MLSIDEDKLKLLLLDRKNKLESPRFRGIAEIISSLSLCITLFLADFSQVTIIPPSYFQMIAWLVVIVIFIYGSISFVKSINDRYTVDDLHSEITRLDPTNESAMCIVLIRESNSTGRYLLYKSYRWKCWLFPNYRCLEGSFDQEKVMQHLRKCLKRDLGLSGEYDISYLGNKISSKYSFGDKIYKNYNFYFFLIGQDVSLSSSLFNSHFKKNGKKYCWKTLDQMYSDKKIVQKNSDVVDYVREKNNIC